MRGIKNKKGHRFKTRYTTPLINILKIKELFKDKDKEGGVNITNFINQLIQILKKELTQLRDSVQELKEVKELDLVEL